MDKKEQDKKTGLEEIVIETIPPPEITNGPIKPGTSDHEE